MMNHSIGKQMVHVQAELMCDVFEFVCVKKRLVIRISQTWLPP